MSVDDAPRTLDKPIAWVCQTYEEAGKTEVRVVREGMSRDEIIEAFPPHRNSRRYGKVYNRKELIKAVIYEAYLEVTKGDNHRARGNVRSFWYERLFYTLISVMQEENTQSVDVAINNAWKDLIEGGWVTYRALNIYSEKESAYHIAVSENSPYPRAIVVVEKASLYEPLHDIADTYQFSFCCTGGQSSRAAAMAYAARLRELGIDVAQDFTVFSFADYDPEGWGIPEAFCQHLSLRVTGQIALIRLGVLKEQLGQSVVQHQAIPYSLTNKRGKPSRGKVTKYENFAQEAGGLFVPGRFDRDVLHLLAQVERDEGPLELRKEGLVPARVELNIYEPDQIRERILAGLSQHIDGFEYQKPKLKEAITRQSERAWDEYCSDFSDAVAEAYEPYHEAIDETRQHLETESARRAPEARRRKQVLQREIAELDKQIDANTADIRAQMDALNGLDQRLCDQERYEDIHDYTPSGLPGTDDLYKKIETNGGWRKWMEDVGIGVLDGEAVARAARRHRRFFWRPDEDGGRRIRSWIRDQYPAPHEVRGPEPSPEELIDEALRLEQ